MTSVGLIGKYQRVVRLLDNLLIAQQNLSRAASVYTGVELNAEICGGGEIEFRRVQTTKGTESIDAESTLRIEDVLLLKKGGDQ